MDVKVVINTCYGGYSLSETAIGLLGGEREAYRRYRHDPELVRVVETLGEDSYGDFARLEVVLVNGSLYRIEEYDGRERIETPETLDWINIP